VWEAIKAAKKREEKKCVENAIKLAPAKGFLKRNSLFWSSFGEKHKSNLQRKYSTKKIYVPLVRINRNEEWLDMHMAHYLQKDQ